jgi:zona occludens toxin (predicted ATPase)
MRNTTFIVGRTRYKVSTNVIYQEDIKNLPDDSNDTRELSQFIHRQFGGSGATLIHFRNTQTGRTATINIPSEGRYVVVGGRKPDSSEFFINTSTCQSVEAKKKSTKIGR